MGLTALEPKRTPLQSTAASLALHALIALAIPSFAWTLAQSPQVETISFTKIALVHVSTPKPLQRAEPLAAAPVRSAAIHLERRRPAPRGPARRHERPQRVQHADVPAQGAPAVAAVAQGAVAAAAPAISAPPQPVASEAPRQVTSIQHHGPAGGYLPLGAEESNPVLDPAVRSAIAALGVHTTLTVVVDEDGKTKSVVFSPELDGTLEAKIRDMLAAAEWDPSVCGGGVSCQGQAVIKL